MFIVELKTKNLNSRRFRGSKKIQPKLRFKKVQDESKFLKCFKECEP